MFIILWESLKELWQINYAGLYANFFYFSSYIVLNKMMENQINLPELSTWRGRVWLHGVGQLATFPFIAILSWFIDKNIFTIFYAFIIAVFTFLMYCLKTIFD
jgi:hypothetical protein